MISTDVQFIKADRENQEKLLLNIDMFFLYNFCDARQWNSTISG